MSKPSEKAGGHAPGQIILLNNSSRWHAALERAGMAGGLSARNRNIHATGHKITWALDLDDVITESHRVYGSIALIELTSSDVRDKCLRMIPHINNSTGLLPIAVGDYELKPWLPLIRRSGFHATLLSLVEVKRVATIADVHFRLSDDHIPRTLEERIESSLPWKPVSGQKTGQ